MKDKEKSGKGRFLSPSFRKGMVKEKKEEEEEGDFKINLIKADDDEEEDEKETKSPSKNKKKSIKGKEDKEKKEHHHHGSTQVVPEDMKVISLPNGHVKNVASQSQAGKGEDGFTKVNQDSFLVLQNEYNLKDFNIFAVMDGHGINGHLVSRFVTKYFVIFS